MKKSLSFIVIASLMACVGVAFAAGVDLQSVAPLAQFTQFDALSAIGLAGAGMTTLAGDKVRPYELGTVQEYPAVAADVIYEGAAVGENASGYARPLVAADPFLGFAESQCDNSAGAAGDKTVRVKMKGQVQLAIADLAITANDRPIVYASDDDTFTLTATGNTAIGRVARWVSTGVAIVEFDALTAASLA